MSEYVAKNVTVTRKPLARIPPCPPMHESTGRRADSWPRSKSKDRNRRRGRKR